MFNDLTRRPKNMDLIANLQLEAMVVGVVCIIVLCLFIVAGIRQVMKEKD